jgi:hypothetical protein
MSNRAEILWTIVCTSALAAVACGGGAPAPATPLAVPAGAAVGCADPKVDDMEDGDTKVLTLKGRGGYWFTYADKSSKVGPSPFVMSSPGADGSKQAARITGKIGTDKTVYVGLGTSLIDPRKPYDASSYKGIAFKAKVGKGSTSVRVKLPDANTDPEAKICKDCYNDFGKDLTLTTDWKRYVVPFKEMTQEPGWGEQKPALAADKVMAIQFQIKESGADYDLWIDDVEFTCQ